MFWPFSLNWGSMSHVSCWHCCQVSVFFLGMSCMWYVLSLMCDVSYFMNHYFIFRTIYYSNFSPLNLKKGTLAQLRNPNTHVFLMDIVFPICNHRHRADDRAVCTYVRKYYLFAKKTESICNCMFWIFCFSSSAAKVPVVRNISHPHIWPERNLQFSISETNIYPPPTYIPDICR